jgi:hypothetical protein
MEDCWFVPWWDKAKTSVIKIVGSFPGGIQQSVKVIFNASLQTSQH